MSLKFRLLSFLSQNTLSRKHDVGILFTWAALAEYLHNFVLFLATFKASIHIDQESNFQHFQNFVHLGYEKDSFLDIVSTSNIKVSSLQVLLKMVNSCQLPVIPILSSHTDENIITGRYYYYFLPQPLGYLTLKIPGLHFQGLLEDQTFFQDFPGVEIQGSKFKDFSRTFKDCTNPVKGYT